MSTAVGRSFCDRLKVARIIALSGAPLLYLPLSQPDAGSTGVLVDELDPAVARKGHKKQLASFCKTKGGPTFFAFFRLVHRLPADLSLIRAVSAGGEQAEL
jgi:hypothetical protein